MRDDGCTILHLAAVWGDRRLIEIIISHNKNYQQKLLLNSQLFTPDELAENKELKEMIRNQHINK